jgi:hypothetical protein
MIMSIDFRDEGERRGDAGDGRKWERADLVDDDVSPAVYGQITSSDAHSRQPLMPLSNDWWCKRDDTPHCNPFGTVVHGGRHA